MPGRLRGRGNIFVMNVGEGTALDIDVTLHLAPNGSRTKLISPMLKSGERRMWNPNARRQRGAEDHPFFPDSAPGRTHLHLIGRCRRRGRCAARSVTRSRLCGTRGRSS